MNFLCLANQLKKIARPFVDGWIDRRRRSRRNIAIFVGVLTCLDAPNGRERERERDGLRLRRLAKQAVNNAACAVIGHDVVHRAPLYSVVCSMVWYFVVSFLHR